LWFPFATIPAPCRRSSVPFAPHTRSLRARSSRPQPVTNSTAAVATIAKRTNLIIFRSPCRWCGTARNAAPHKMESQPPSNHCWQGIKGTRDARFRPQRMVLGRKLTCGGAAGAPGQRGQHQSSTSPPRSSLP
jgi:hypothetical protein